MKGFASSIFADIFQNVAAPIVRAVMATQQPGVFISADHQGSFLDLVLRAVAAGTSDRIRTIQVGPYNGISKRLSGVDGTTFEVCRAVLAPDHVKKSPSVISIDRIGLLANRVVAIALDGQAVAEKAWRGADAVIARDKPVFVAYAQGDPNLLDDLALRGYSIKQFEIWTYPKRSTLIIMAIPEERMSENATYPTPCVDIPGVSRLGSGNTDNRPTVPYIIFPQYFDIQAGFYNVESGEDMSWVWSGPGREGQFVLPQRWIGLQRFTTVVLGVAGGTINDLRFKVNGKPARCRANGNVVEVEGFTEPSDFSGGMKVSIVTPRTSRQPGDDPRPLGCCLSKIEMEWA